MFTNILKNYSGTFPVTTSGTFPGIGMKLYTYRKSTPDTFSGNPFYQILTVILTNQLHRNYVFKTIKSLPSVSMRPSTLNNLPQIYKAFSYQPTTEDRTFPIISSTPRFLSQWLSKNTQYYTKQSVESSYFLHYTTNNLSISKQKVGSSYFTIVPPATRSQKPQNIRS